MCVQVRAHTHTHTYVYFNIQPFLTKNFWDHWDNFNTLNTNIVKCVPQERAWDQINFSTIFEENGHINSKDKIAGDGLAF